MEWEGWASVQAEGYKNKEKRRKTMIRLCESRDKSIIEPNTNRTASVACENNYTVKIDSKNPAFKLRSSIFLCFASPSLYPHQGTKIIFADGNHAQMRLFTNVKRPKKLPHVFLGICQVPRIPLIALDRRYQCPINHETEVPRLIWTDFERSQQWSAHEVDSLLCTYQEYEGHVGM